MEFRGIHIHAPKPDSVTWLEPKETDMQQVKTYCCRDKKLARDCKIKAEHTPYYGFTWTFYCKGDCNEKTKRDGRRTATIIQGD